MLLCFLLAIQVPDTIRYEVAFPNAVHHEAQVSVSFPARGRDTLEVWMSRSSPGRYALHEFAKNVYGVTAEDGAGRPVTVVRRDPYRWLVTGHDGVVTFRYTLFADRADGTYSGIDATHAHLNMPATFAWARGLEQVPMAVRFVVPPASGWRAATQLVPTGDPLRFTAPDVQYFMDSPTELSAFDLRAWTVPSRAGDTQTIRLALHHQGTDAELDAYAEMARKVVAEQIAVWGEAPTFDHGTYTFIADYLPWVSGDGMEHRNSTILSSTGALATASLGVLGTLSHEFFHAWNIERLRPASLEPFDFTQANPSDALWFGEGFTSYYDDLTIRRAGLIDDAAYAAGITGVINTVVLSPGRGFFSPREMSLQAAFVDAATSVDPVNRGNTFISYYTWGAAIGLGLDLTLRTRFPGRTLDGYLRALWDAFGRNEERYVVARPYTLADLEATLGRYTGDVTFARDFFARYIHGREVVDYGALLEAAGFLLRPASPDVAFLGTVNPTHSPEGATLGNAPLIGSPLYAAGVERGDRIISLAGHALRTQADWERVLGSLRPGMTVPIVFVQRGATRSASLRVAADPRLEVVPLEAAGRTLTAAHRAFRDAWLGSQIQP